MLRVGLCTMAASVSPAAAFHPSLLRPAASVVGLRGGARPLSMMAAEDEIRAFMTTCIDAMDECSKSNDAGKIEAWLKEYTADEGFFVRPSGNPLPFTGLKEMWTAADVSVTQAKLVSVDTVKVFAGGNAAVVTYMMHDKFEFKGTPNDDYAKNTAVLEKIDGKWSWIHGHRATGQPPPE